MILLSNKIEEARKKITFAEYLLSQDDSKNFAVGAMKHILDAAKLGLAELTQFELSQVENVGLITQHFKISIDSTSRCSTLNTTACKFRRMP